MSFSNPFSWAELGLIRKTALPGVALILDIKLREQPSVADEVSIL